MAIRAGSMAAASPALPCSIHRADSICFIHFHSRSATFHFDCTRVAAMSQLVPRGIFRRVGRATATVKSPVNKAR